MSLFDDLDDRDNQNALNILAGHSYHEVEQAEPGQLSFDDLNREQNCVTYQWLWKDDQHIQEQLDQGTPMTEDNVIDQMKSARAEQEEKVKHFLSKVKPINTMVRKASLEDKTEAGSPKKKKIKKMLSFK